MMTMMMMVYSSLELVDGMQRPSSGGSLFALLLQVLQAA